MQQLFTQILAQPYVLPIMLGVAGLIVGLLIPKKGGASWLSAIIFFVPNLVLDLLDMVHTKKFKYYGLILALLSIEAFFAFRASTVYYDVLNPRMAPAEMMIVCILVFVAVGLCGYMVATHGKLTWASGATMVFVIIHDWAGTAYMNYAGAKGDVFADPLKLVLTIGMCVLSILPFIMGAWAEELRPQLQAEQEEEVNAFTSLATRKIKRRAVDRVLRLASHTNVVHLVRALPADEFADFKAFVMPIIAPGTPYNLTEMAQIAGATPESNPPSDSQESGQTGGQKTGNVADQNRQTGESQPDKKADTKPAKRQPSTGQTGGQTGSQATGQNAGQNGNTQPATKTAKRDEKIRQHAAKYPSLTHAKLAARFHVSERTIARALVPTEAANSQQQEPAKQDGEQTNAAPSHNGHHREHERDTDELEQVTIDERELVGSAHQN